MGRGELYFEARFFTMLTDLAIRSVSMRMLEAWRDHGGCHLHGLESL